MDERIVFWANLWEPGGQVGSSKVSPNFGTQAELVGWVRHYRNDNTQVTAWKRTIRGADYHDERLGTQDDPPADPERLNTMLREMTRLLDAKKRDLDRPSRRVA